eukprot:GHRR01004742.1.p1 GENE.GHRR01004742.1~~GHRR01004742.1.p1  ORF type:complete len:239 (+),score=44.42 GHRR01004742.1:186-902(+)
MHQRCLRQTKTAVRPRTYAHSAIRPPRTTAVQTNCWHSPEQPDRVLPIDPASLINPVPGTTRLTSLAGKLPHQADQLFNPGDNNEDKLIALVDKPATRSIADLDYLSELLAIQQNDGPKNLGFFGTRNMGMTHQKLVEILSYAMVSTGNHIYTSGAIGTNAAVIKGALRAEQADLLTVILPQSLCRQPQESQELLAQVQNVVEMPQYDHLSLLEASRWVSRVVPLQRFYNSAVGGDLI